MLPEILHRIVYGLIAGIAECLPVSSQAHQLIYRHMFGFDPRDPWLTVCVLAGSLTSIIFCYRRKIGYLLHENTLSKPSRRRKSHPPEQTALLTLRICKTVLFFIVISVFFYGKAHEWIKDFDVLALMLIINGVILFIPRLVPSGNKDCMTMSRLDSVLMGIFGAIGIIPGISRVGGIAAAASARGTESSFAADLALLISVVPLTVILGISFIGAFLSHSSVSGAMFLGNLLSLFSSFGGGCFGIWLLRSICKKTSVSVFAYYSFGAGLTALALYMIV